MRLLVITQAVDKDDPVLGFFHRWIEEFSRKCEQITVICLKRGDYNLPDNVKVFSLGKEEKVSRIHYVINFYKHIWRERKNYDSVFVHMNQEYVLLGALLWKFLNKKVAMWRNHTVGNFLTRVSVALSNKVFCTSDKAFVAKYKKTKIMPVGIDMQVFSRDKNIERGPRTILFLSRISPVKKLELILDALYILEKDNIDFKFSIVGDPTPKDEGYYKKIKIQAIPLESNGKAVFSKGVPNSFTPKIFNEHDLFINATQIGSFDKTLLEALACECLLITSNTAVKDIIPQEFLFREGDAKDMAEKIRFALSLNEEEKEKYRQFGRNHIKEHGLDNLTAQLFKELLK